jgi:hypothetical protein
VIYHSLTPGRLGNQLFEVAASLGIAEKTGHKAAFPAWKYESYFEHPLPHSTLNKYKPLQEPSFRYHPEEILERIYPAVDYELKGYFQSYKYWNKGHIKYQFTFLDELKKSVSHKFREQLSKSTVAISVRRGDFVGNPNYFQIPVSWYLNAYYRHFEGDSVIVFTDDIAWCKRHFRALQHVSFTEGLNDIEQLCLMSMCDNHIISNSTFSWWGAYLSDSEKIIRPEKNFAGNLADLNDESDYWPPQWEIFTGDKIDLKDTTFIIPVHYDHEDRRQNLMLSLGFLHTYFDTNILIGEQGSNQFEELNIYADYVHFSYDNFHRTKIINELIRLSETNIVVNWDCDNICSPSQLAEAVNQIRDGMDIVYPFDGTVYRVPRYLFATAMSLDVHDIDINKCAEKHSSVGHAVVMNKDAFNKAGMENEHFISWGPEDSERFNRYNILGLKIKRIEGAIYHLDHYVGINSSNRNTHFKDNEREFLKVATKRKPDLEAYIKTWAWVN